MPPAFQCGSNRFVISRGNALSRLMLVGEAPGANEEISGKPFVGRSGKLLDNLLEIAGIDQEEEIFICNVLKTRPPKNRKPTQKEIRLHLPWLLEQIKDVKPLVIVLAGATATYALLGIKTKLTLLRGTWQNWKGIPVMPIFHPSYLLRNPSKAEGAPIDLTRLDLEEVRKKWTQLNHL
ncbi:MULTISPECIES: uracil-DNA glycosylase [Prochlorococcus]|uniref:uracil-DNA glycosylase n=1 Tax=Prochlorococcus TaxID=1218 RepID=UPI000533A8C8|nr:MULTISPECIES: uracil-DNA glycosylase [Prochlorococcus]KGG12554.1 Uracil-DNA glycosylase [Prochlorococcus sp. MIT 0601]